MSRVDELRAEYERLAHAMQSGVKVERDREEFNGVGEEYRSTGPKHLRVGVNVALSDHGALANLLIKKGVITQEEYLEEIVEFMRREVRGYEARLSEKYQTKITLA